MNYDFVAQYAPELAVPPQEGWVTPEPQAGLQNLYGADGMPLNYIQDQGGPRQFYAPQGAYAAPVRARAAPAPSQLGGLRGSRDSVNVAPFDLPYFPAAPVRPPEPDAPQNILTPRSTATAGPMYTPEQGSGTPGGISPNANVPGNPRDIALGNRVAGLAMDQRAMENVRNPQEVPLNEAARLPGALAAEGATLLDMLESAQFPVPEFLRNIGTPNRRPAEGLRGRGQRGNTVRLDNIRPFVDIEADLRDQPRVTRTSSILNGFPNFNTPEGLANFNQRMGLQLGNQVRTRAEQDALIAAGRTRAVNSRHIDGHAVDVPSSQIGGRTGQEAIEYVKQQWIAAGYPPNAEFRWESGRGRNQGTGRHVHIEPSN